MTISEKQLIANRENAKKGGVKTEEGKAIVRHNALKHGLLAKEVVISAGEGAENLQEFEALINDLKDQLRPEGTLEEMLVEKIAVSYWRMRRIYRFETGMIRSEILSATDNFYGKKTLQGQTINRTEDELNELISEENKSLRIWSETQTILKDIFKEGRPLEDIYKWKTLWSLFSKIQFVKNMWLEDPGDIRIALNEAGWSDEKIWHAIIDHCSSEIESRKVSVKALEKELDKNILKLQAIKEMGNLPPMSELKNLLRYETSIERQLYKVLNELERLQRRRAGEFIPAPLKVDFEVNNENAA